MISIVPKVADNENFITFEELPSSDIKSGDSRVSRSATLDGGCAVDNYGYTDSDRTLTIEAELTSDQYDILWTLFTVYTEIYVSFADGFFSGVISTMNLSRQPASFTILLEEVS